MIHLSVDEEQSKGWFVGPWNSAVSIPIGYANKGIDQRHYHAQMYEAYLVARGESTAVVGDSEIPLKAGDLLVVEPGEVHTFVWSSADYLHFVIHIPFIPEDKVLVD